MKHLKRYDILEKYNENLRQMVNGISDFSP